MHQYCSRFWKYNNEQNKRKIFCLHGAYAQKRKKYFKTQLTQLYVKSICTF